MIKEKQFGDIFIKPFEESMRTALSEFQLNERQQVYSSLPKEVLDDKILIEDQMS